MTKDILQTFVVWLQNEKPDLTQSAIARRSGLSQSLIYKLVAGMQRQETSSETTRALVEAYPQEWTEFLRRHPEARQQLRERYGWARVTSPSTENHGFGDARLGEAVAAFRQILTAGGDVADLALMQLRHLAAFSQRRTPHRSNRPA